MWNDKSGPGKINIFQTGTLTEQVESDNAYGRLSLRPTVGIYKTDERRKLKERWDVNGGSEPLFSFRFFFFSTSIPVYISFV